MSHLLNALTQRVRIGSLVLGLMIATSSPSIAQIRSSDSWTMVLTTPLGDPVFINYNQLERNGSTLIPTLDESSVAKLFQQAIHALAGGTTSPPPSRILEVETGTASDFMKWYWDQAADRRFAERVIRSGGKRFADLISGELKNPDPMIRIELLRIALRERIPVNEETLGALVADPETEVQFLALTFLAGRAGASTSSAAAARLASARPDSDEYACLGLRLGESHGYDPEAQRAAWALLSSMATRGIDYRLARELDVRSVSCDARFVLRSLAPATDRARAETLRRLSGFVAANGAFAGTLAWTVAQDPVLSSYWTAAFVPYWRAEVARYLGNPQPLSIELVFPQYRMAAEALAKQPSVEDAQLLLRMALHRSPISGEMLSKSIEACAASNSFDTHADEILDALARYAAQLESSHGVTPDDDPDAFSTLLEHVAELKPRVNVAEAIWKIVLPLRAAKPALAQKLSSAIKTENPALGDLLEDRFPDFDPALLQARRLEATCWAAPEFSACDFFKRLDPAAIETSWGMDESQKMRIVASNFTVNDSVCDGSSVAWHVARVDTRRLKLEQCGVVSESVELRVYRKSAGGHVGSVIATTGNHGFYGQFKFFDIPGDGGPLKKLSGKEIGVAAVRRNELLAKAQYFATVDNARLTLVPAADDDDAIEAMPDDYANEEQWGSRDVIRRILFVWDGRTFRKKVRQIDPPR